MGGRDASLSLDQVRADAVWLRRLAHAVVRGERAEDAAQDTWLARLTHAPDPEGGLRAWLRAVLTNGIRKQRRSEARRRTREAAVVDPAAFADDAETLVLRLEARRILAELTVALEEPLRTVVLLCYEEGLSPSDIARRQGVPAGTVRWRLKQARDRLRAGLEARHAGRPGWRGLFLSLAHPRRAFTWKGVLLMKTSTKVGAAVLVLALALLGARIVRMTHADGKAGASEKRSPGAAATTPAHARDVPATPRTAKGSTASVARVHIPRFTTAPAGADATPPAVPLGLRLADGKGHLKDRRTHPGPEEAHDVARAQAVLDEMKERANACLERWPVMDPLLAKGVMLKVNFDPGGLQDVSIVGLSAIPDGPMRCFSDAVYQLDWSGISRSPLEATTPLRYDRPDGGAAPQP
jgi:RNA polymerase sigma-70 factor (ECF subfamily)